MSTTDRLDEIPLRRSVRLWARILQMRKRVSGAGRVITRSTYLFPPRSKKLSPGLGKSSKSRRVFQICEIACKVERPEDGEGGDGAREGDKEEDSDIGGVSGNTIESWVND